MRGARADARDAREVSLNAPRRAARARRPDECGIPLARTASRCDAHRTHEEGILERLQRTHQPKVICFSDLLFGAGRNWTEALLEGIGRLGLDNFFWCETRADLMTPALLDKLDACRFKVDFGVDTGSETMARRMVKS